MIAVVCNKKNIIKVLRCRNESQFDKLMQDSRLKWGHLIRKEDGLMITQRHNVDD